MPIVGLTNILADLRVRLFVRGVISVDSGQRMLLWRPLMSVVTRMRATRYGQSVVVGHHDCRPIFGTGY